jgi:hypothetical protein
MSEWDDPATPQTGSKLERPALSLSKGRFSGTSLNNAAERNERELPMQKSRND